MPDRADDGRDVAPLVIQAVAVGRVRPAESPRHLYVTDALAAVLPDVRIQELAGQAHEAMTTAPAMYAEAVARALAATT